MFSHAQILEVKESIISKLNEYNISNMRILVPKEEGVLPFRVLVSTEDINNCLVFQKYLRNALKDITILVYSDNVVEELLRDPDIKSDFDHNIPIANIDEQHKDFSDYFS